MTVTFRDFQPINNWTLESGGERCSCEVHRGQPKFLIDQTTGRKYYNQPEEEVRYRCFVLALATPIVYSIISVANIARRILNLVTLSHFWIEKEGETKYSLLERLADAGKDILRIVAAPVSIVGLELASLYGWFRPYDGRKLYASIERATYGEFVLWTVFQPQPRS